PASGGQSRPQRLEPCRSSPRSASSRGSQPLPSPPLCRSRTSISPHCPRTNAVIRPFPWRHYTGERTPWQEGKTESTTRLTRRWGGVRRVGSAGTLRSRGLFAGRGRRRGLEPEQGSRVAVAILAPKEHRDLVLRRRV